MVLPFIILKVNRKSKFHNDLNQVDMLLLEEVKKENDLRNKPTGYLEKRQFLF